MRTLSFRESVYYALLKKKMQRQPDLARVVAGNEFKESCQKRNPFQLQLMPSRLVLRNLSVSCVGGFGQSQTLVA